MSLFVTATGSDMGKTVVCALLAHRYANAQTPMHYWKPIATGIAPQTATHVRRLAAPHTDAAAAVSDSQSYMALAQPVGQSLTEAYRFTSPVAPHWAARQARQPITLPTLTEAYRQHRRHHPRLLIEGIGGCLVPLNEQGETLADWLATLQLPCVVVAHTGLGTLNHTLLTLEALQRRGIFVAGIVLNGPAHPDNRRSLAAFAKVPIIDSVTWMTPLSATAVARRAQQFDPQNVLAPYFSTT